MMGPLVLLFELLGVSIFMPGEMQMQTGLRLLEM